MQHLTQAPSRRAALLRPLLPLLLVPVMAFSGLPLVAVLGQAAATVLAVDFVAGALHWLEDSYGDPTWPVIGPHVIEPNQEHHRDPRAMTRKSWLQSATVPLVLTGAVLGVAGLLGLFDWRLLLAAVLAVNANEIHKWAHRSKSENGPVVRLLHRLRLVQGPRSHAMHHGHAKDTHYCVLTDHLNPVLDGLGFWRGLEAGIERLFGVKRRPDPTVPLAYGRR